ncbi:carboxypeptidase-like regulatory domain-containing protein [Pedobacter antarcticus]|nr:carboxypeptidase-like regulatory domain-containing protein [Pedobacter antarcticus]
MNHFKITKNSFHIRLKGYALLILLTCSLTAGAQEITAKGILTDENAIPLPWVNIGIKKKNIGSMSKANGKFELQIPSTSFQDTLLFSYVGYHDQAIPISAFQTGNENKIILKKSTHQLQEVVITNRKKKIRKLGTTGYTPMVWVSISFKNKNDFAEQAQLIKISEPTRLLEVRAKVAGNKKKTDSVNYRLNIYAVKDGLPGPRILEKNLIKSFSMAEREISFDLTRESIFTDKDCIVSFEYIPKGNTEHIDILSFRASITGKGGYSRKASIGDWTPMSAGSGSIYAIVEQ